MSRSQEPEEFGEVAEMLADRVDTKPDLVRQLVLLSCNIHQ
jgi:hypothetical protein